MNVLSKEAINAMDHTQETINTEMVILHELNKKRELVFNPETLTHAQREAVLNLKYREDIYLVANDEGKWKIWKRIFN